MYSYKNISDSNKAKTKIIFLSFILYSYFFAPYVFLLVFFGVR